MGREINKTLQLDWKKLLFLSLTTPEWCFSLVFYHNKYRHYYFYKYPQCVETLSFHFVARKSLNIKKNANITYAALCFHLYSPSKYRLFITKILEHCNRNSVMIFKNKKERKYEKEGGTLSLFCQVGFYSKQIRTWINISMEDNGTWSHFEAAELIDSREVTSS